MLVRLAGREAELDYGVGFMAARRLGEPDEAASAPP